MKDYNDFSIESIKKSVAKKKNYKESRKSKQKSLLPNNVKEITNDFGETLVRVDGTIPPGLEVTNGQRFLFISYDQSRYSHGLHKYPAKFFPELPRWLIQKYSRENDIILDPFTGSATTNIEAKLSNRHSVGIDVDPFSRYVAKVKSMIHDIDEINNTNDQLLEELKKFKPSAIQENEIPEFPYRDNWFEKFILNELTYINKLIKSLDVKDSTRDYYRVCFSSIIRNVSNADNNCTRTVVRKSLNKNIYPSMALTKFGEEILVNLPGISEYAKKANNGKIIEIPDDSDARDIKYPNEYFDLAVTSPPYVNAVDYPRTHQLEIYWLGFTRGSLTPLKKKHVGTESVSVKNYKDLHEIGVKEADNVIEKIYSEDKRRAYIAYKYLSDMEKNFSEVYRTLKNGGKYIVVVGNNTIRGNNFESWKYLMKIGERVGFKVENYFGSEIIRHFIKVPRDERIDTDWIIVLEK